MITWFFLKHLSKHINTLSKRLIDATEAGDLESVRDLLACGAEVNARNADDETALILAAGKGYLEIVTFLVAHQANVDAKTTRGLTALILAAEKGHFEIVRLLVTHQANVNIQSKYGPTALILAAGKGHFEIVKFLVAHGANVNAQDKCGSTALIFATISRHVEIVRFLLAEKSNLDHKDSWSETALTHASREIASLLLAYGATPMAKSRPNIILMSQHLQSALEVALKRPLSADIVPALLKACTLLLRLRRGILCPTDEEVSKWITLINEKHFITEQTDTEQTDTEQTDTEQTDTEQTNLVLSPKLIDLVLPLELILQIRAAWWAQDLASTIAKKYQLKLDDVQPLCKLLEKNTSLLNQLCKVRAHHDWRQPWEPTVTLEPSPSLALR